MDWAVGVVALFLPEHDVGSSCCVSSSRSRALLYVCMYVIGIGTVMALIYQSSRSYNTTLILCL